MRLAALSLSALMLAACGGLGGDVTAPTEAPKASGEVIEQMFEICGTAINRGAVIDALPEAATLGWELETDTYQASLPLDIMRNTALRHPETDHALHFYEHDGPHEKFMGCQLFDSSGGDERVLNPAVFDNMPGFEGRWTATKDGSAGRWSKRAGNSVLSIQVIQNGDSFSMISMNKIILK